MNKLFSKIATLSVGLAMAIGVGFAVGSKEARVARAEDVSFVPSNFSGQGTSGTGSAISATVNGVTFACDKGYGTTQIRCYSGGKITISSSNTIDAISFTFSGSYTGGLGTSYNDLSTTSWEISLSSQARITECLVTLAGSSDVLQSITVSGAMTKTEYTTAESWSAAGLTATGTYETAGQVDITNKVTWSFDPATPAVSVTSVVATATLGTVSGNSDAQSVSVEAAPEPITLNSSNWPVSATSTHDDVQESTLDGIVYQNVRGYIYNSSQLSLNYKVDAYFGNKTPYSRNIKSIVVTYTANVTSYVKMYEGNAPLAKTSQVTQSGTTTVTYTFSDTKPYFRLNMDTSTPKGTYCNITSMVINFGSLTDVVDLEDISLNGNKSLPVGVTFASVLTLDPANANNKDTIAWSSSNSSVATVDNSGVVTTVGVGEATITATATELTGVSASYVLTVFQTTSSIQKLYYLNDGTSSGEFYGYYVGFLDGTGPVLMDGEFGIVLFSSSYDVSGWTAGQTIVHVKSGTISIFNGLFEVKNFELETVESATVASPVVYATKGEETEEYANRLTTVTGTGTVTSGSFDDAAGTSDIKMNFTVGSKTIQVFYKKAAQTADATTFAAVKDAVTNGTEITVKGFTSWYNGFQVQMNGYIPPVEDYTAEEFAQDLLDQTDNACSAYPGSDNDPSYDYSAYKTALEAIWSDLASDDKYPSLPKEQKDILAEASREGTSTISRAMKRYDFLTGKYDLSNFIVGRTPIASPSGRYGVSDLTADNNTMIIVISIAATSALAFTMLLVFKKKKQK